MTFSRILVDIDGSAAAHPALAAAVEIAGRCGAALTIVDVLPDVPRLARRFLTPTLEAELVAHRREQLVALAEGVTRVPTRTGVLRGRPATALVEEVRRHRYDLLIRSHVRDLSEQPRQFGSVDMELLRHCPCPVWLIGPSPTDRPQRMLAAVHTATDDEGEVALNRQILELALYLRELEHAELTVLEAWSLFGEELLRPRLSEADLARELGGLQADVERSLRGLVDSFGAASAGATVAAVKGRAEKVIPEYVRTHDIDVVVMGTVARGGVAGLLMGNTAQHVLQHLRGSVLAVKPPRFATPVPAPDADPWVARHRL